MGRRRAGEGRTKEDHGAGRPEMPKSRRVSPARQRKACPPLLLRAPDYLHGYGCHADFCAFPRRRKRESTERNLGLLAFVAGADRKVSLFCSPSARVRSGRVRAGVLLRRQQTHPLRHHPRRAAEEAVRSRAGLCWWRRRLLPFEFSLWLSQQAAEQLGGRGGGGGGKEAGESGWSRRGGGRGRERGRAGECRCDGHDAIEAGHS